MHEIFKKHHKALTQEDLQALAEAPLSVTKKYFECQEIKNEIRLMRMKLPKLSRSTTQQKYLEEIEALETKLNNAIDSVKVAA